MSLGTLWTIPTQAPAKAIRAVAVLGDLKIDLPAEYTHYQDNKKPEFTSKFPHGKIPAWEGKDGFLLFESVAILRYLASLAPNSTLLGSSPQESALVDQWLSFVSTEIVPWTILTYQICTGITPYNKPTHQKYVENQVRSFKTLNEHLATRTFLVGERITAADLLLAAILQQAFRINFDAALRSELYHVVRYAETIVNQPKIKDLYGPTEYSEKALQFIPPPKEKKEAKPEKKAEEKKAEKPKKVADDDDEEDDKPIEEPKGKNPLDLLPKSTFNLEDWKRAYSNMDTRGPGGSLEWFYEKFDKEGFSIWRVDFKYPEELTLTFMSSNLIGGFFNRLEASRKYLFGSMGVLGTNNNSVISGALILRGLDVKPVVDVAPDWESYEFKKIDLSNKEDKEFFEAALAWDLKIGDKEWVDGKNFK